MKNLINIITMGAIATLIFNPLTVGAQTNSKNNDLDCLQPSPSPLVFPTKPSEVEVKCQKAITLQQAIDLALTNNKEIQVYQLNIEKSQAALKEAEAAKFPTLDVNAQYSIEDSASGQIRNNIQQIAEKDVPPALRRELSDTSSISFTGNLQLNYELYTGGRIQGNIAIAEKQIRLDSLELEKRKQQLQLDTTNRYYDVQQADEEVVISEAAVKNSSQNLKDTENLEKAGLGTKFDVLRAKVQLANAQQDLVQAKSQQIIARRSLVQILGLSQNAEVSSGEPVIKSGEWRLSLEDTIVLAYKNRAELEQQLLQRDLSEERRKVAIASSRAQVGVFAEYNITDIFADHAGPGDGYRIGARVNWNLFDGGSGKAKQRQQEVNKEIAAVQFSDVRNQIRLQIEQAYYNLDANNQNIKTTELALEQAEESLRLANLRFKAGVGTQTEVLNSETELTRAKVNRLRAILGYNRALATLQRGVSNVPDSRLFKQP